MSGPPNYDYETGYPTSNLRFVEREIGATINNETVVRKIRILQQQWFYERHKDGKVDRGHEWRDVPLGAE